MMKMSQKTLQSIKEVSEKLFLEQSMVNQDITELTKPKAERGEEDKLMPARTYLFQFTKYNEGRKT